MDKLLSLNNFVSVENLENEDVEKLIKRAEYFKNGGEAPHLNKEVYVANLFFENSTRTHTSFEMVE